MPSSGPVIKRRRWVGSHRGWRAMGTRGCAQRTRWRAMGTRGCAQRARWRAMGTRGCAQRTRWRAMGTRGCAQRARWPAIGTRGCALTGDQAQDQLAMPVGVAVHGLQRLRALLIEVEVVLPREADSAVDL